MTKEEQVKLNNVMDLLILIEERQRAIKEEDLAGINNRLKDLNGSVLKNTIRGVTNEQKVKSIFGSLGMFKWIIGLEFLMLITIIGLLVWLI